MTSYLWLALTAAFPVAATALLYPLDRRIGSGKVSSGAKQVIYGLIFGAVSMVCSEFGVPINGAVINVRDAAPLCAGLVFGAPAGIVAGLIGGLERWFSVYWGGGTVTRLACSVSTCLAGFFAAAMRKGLFDDKKPAWYYGFAAGLIMEVLHMLMVFFTNMSDVRRAFQLVQVCSAPMILTNALSVMLAVLSVSLLGKEKIYTPKEHRKLTQTFSRCLLAVVLVAFAVTSLFTFVLQTSFSTGDSEDLLSLNLSDVKADIEDASDENLLALTRSVAADLNTAAWIDNALLEQVSGKPGNDFSEINVVNEQGVIVCSTTPEYLGFDMAQGEQSQEFLALLGGEAELVQRYQPISKDGTYMKYAGVALEQGGFVQVGYDAERFRRDVDTQVIGATRNRHVGENGFLIIAGDDWNIVSDPHGYEGQNLDATGIYIDRDAMPENTRFRAEVYGTPCFCMYTLTEGYYIIAVEPVDDVLFSRDLSVYVTVFMEVLVFAALFGVVYVLIKKLVVENIHEINRTLKEITGGNLDVSVDVRTNEEFVSLSDDINSTVLTLKGCIAEAAARIDKELEVAKIIQSSTLPSVFPPYPDRGDLDIFASMDTAREVGGDFYDFYLLDGDRLAFLVADVSGKGITAAMFMMKAKTLIKSYAEKEHTAAEILTLANAALCEENEAEMFVTCWMGILNTATHTVTFANAGHNPPLVRRGDGNFEYFKTRPGFVLGGMEGTRYCLGELKLFPGDAIFLYTDGVTEATDAQGGLYGDDRLLQAVIALSGSSAEALCRGVREDVDRFVGNAPQFDDMTMLCLRLLPQNSITLRPVRESMEKAVAFVEDTLERAGVPRLIIAKMNIAVDEIFSNIIQYSGAGEADLQCGVRDGKIRLVFTDDGKPYDPTQQADPDTTVSAEEREIGGLGIFMVKRSMDSVVYAYRDGRNILTLTKTI